jgi:hypothetical protein
MQILTKPFLKMVQKPFLEGLFEAAFYLLWRFKFESFQDKEYAKNRQIASGFSI